MAVIECVVAVRVDSDRLAMPEPLTLPVPRSSEPSRNRTVPVGEPALEVTVAKSLTESPKVGDGTLDDTVVVVAAEPTVRIDGTEELVMKLELPT